MSFKTAILDLLFPPKCPFCGSLTEGDPVCPDCERDLPYRPEGKTIQMVDGLPCAIAFYYDGPVKEGIRALKFGRKSSRAKIFGKYIAQTAAEYLGGQFDAVTFVPVSPLRNYVRGFDQAQLLAEAAAAHWGVKVQKILVKTRNNRPQSSVQAPEERRANVLGAYRVPHPERAAGRRFLLIDDVCTTGSTLSAAASALLAAGAESVVCAALAGGHSGRKTAEDGAPVENPPPVA